MEVISLSYLICLAAARGSHDRLGFHEHMQTAVETGFAKRTMAEEVAPRMISITQDKLGIRFNIRDNMMGEELV